VCVDQCGVRCWLVPVCGSHRTSCAAACEQTTALAFRMPSTAMRAPTTTPTAFTTLVGSPRRAMSHLSVEVVRLSRVPVDLAESHTVAWHCLVCCAHAEWDEWSWLYTAPGQKCSSDQAGHNVDVLFMSLKRHVELLNAGRWMSILALVRAVGPPVCCGRA